MADSSTILLETSTRQQPQPQQEEETNAFDFSSMNVHSTVEDYMLQNMDRYQEGSMETLEEEIVATKQFRNMQTQANKYVPSFEGYLTLDFSIHVPCDHTTLLDCRLSIDSEAQKRLESLVMLFLCSQGVELVISTAPTSLLHVCPFSDRGEGGTVKQPRAAGALQDPMILWNLPRFESESFPFDELTTTTGESETTIVDQATNTTFILTNGPPQQYYTTLEFTYPVYQWGSTTSTVEESLQDEFDAKVVSTGTLDTLLPWPDSQAAPAGLEPQIFWNAPPARVFNTTLPAPVGSFLQSLGYILMVVNTLAIVGLSLVAQCRKNRRERLAQIPSKDQHWRNTGEHRPLESAECYLDTEAILMESKHYALAKSAAYSQSQARSHTIATGRLPPAATTTASSSGDRTIAGVEVMVDEAPRSRSSSQSSSSSSSLSQSSKNSKNNNSPTNPHYDHLRRSPDTKAAEKEDLLLAKVKLRNHAMAAASLSTPWYSDQKLLKDDDDDDEADKDDLQILDLVTPPASDKSVSGSHVSKMSHSSVRSKSSRGSYHQNSQNTGFSF